MLRLLRGIIMWGKTYWEDRAKALEEELKNCRNSKTVATFGPINSREVYTFTEHLSYKTTGLYSSESHDNHYFFATADEAFNSSFYKNQSVTKKTLITIDDKYFYIGNGELVQVDLGVCNLRVTRSNR